MGDVIELKPETTTVDVVNPNDLPKLWPDIKSMVDDACHWSSGQFTPRAVVDGMLDGSFIMAMFSEGAKPTAILVITISEFRSGKRVLEVLLASGINAKSWMEHEHKIIDLARHYGCAGLRMIGREGLQKFLQSWKRTAIVLEREID